MNTKQYYDSLDRYRRALVNVPDGDKISLWLTRQGLVATDEALAILAHWVAGEPVEIAVATVNPQKVRKAKKAAAPVATPEPAPAPVAKKKSPARRRKPKAKA